jgi:RNA polymerase sigma-70 factor, ECF subfamily
MVLDETSASWLRDLAPGASRREPAVARLHGMLVGVARAELKRRAGSDIAGPELDDLAHQSSADSVVAILAKLDSFRGDSRFTTWAYRFVILDVSTKLGRHFWRTPRAALHQDDWERLPGRSGLDPADRAEWQDLITAIRNAVEHELTPRQRDVFSAVVLGDVPLDALAAKRGADRNAISKTLFDARRKLRRTLTAQGYLASPAVMNNP